MLDHRRSELMLVGLFVWLIVGAVVFIVLALPFIVPQHQLAQFIPECVWQSQLQKPCAFCGMSTAFYAISRGDFAQAFHLNSLSLYIYFIFFINTLFVVITAKRSIHFIKNTAATLHSGNVLS